MAEFCEECWKEMNGDVKWLKYTISEELDLCEGREQWKPVVIVKHQGYDNYIARLFILPFGIIHDIIFILWKLFSLPCLIVKKINLKKGNLPNKKDRY